VNAALSASLGQLPGPGLGGALGAGLRFRIASLALEAHASKGLSRDLEPRGHLNGSLLAAGLSGCVHLASLALCAVGYGGLQRLGTLDVASPNTSSGLYVGFGPRLSVELPVTRQVAFTVGLAGLLNATRNTALLSGREVWKTPLLGATLSVGTLNPTPQGRLVARAR
jgi:hypothetical protein